MQGEKDMPERVIPSAIERHIQTVLVAIMTALIVWGGNSLIDNKETMTRIEERFVAMSDKVERVIDSVEKMHALELRVIALEVSCRRCNKENGDQ